MKKIATYAIVGAALAIAISACDKKFEKINTNPALANSLSPEYLFSNAQRLSAISTHHYQGAIVQQMSTPYGGLNAAGNRNIVNDQHSSAPFNDLYGGPIRYLTHIIEQPADDPSFHNLIQMARIWRAYCFQLLVDTYGDIPYSEAGKGYSDAIFLPRYDSAPSIYEAIVAEYVEATDLLDPNSKTFAGADLFYDGNIAQWKRLGNSLLLRAGMRYTEIDEDKARTIVNKALESGRGGVLASVEDDAYIQFNETYTNGTSSSLLAGERANFYIGAPFVEFLKQTNDPRIRYIAVRYENPSNPLATAGAANTNPADQIGMPYGYDENSVEDAPGFPGKIGSAFKYSQFNRETVIRITAPEYMVSYSQTLLLLAEAHVRGYLAIGDAEAYYNQAIQSNMEQIPLFGLRPDISDAAKQQFLEGGLVKFNPANALKQINEQYWVSSLRNWSEAWANFRRSGYPQLQPVNFPSQDPSVNSTGEGFIRRLVYPLKELSANSANVQEAVSRMGADNLGTPVFWDN